MNVRTIGVVVLVAMATSGALAQLRNDEAAARRRCWSSGNGQRAQWWPEGSRVDRGRYWYECVNGKLEPKGCFSHDRQRIMINGNYVHNSYEMTCVLGYDGFLTFDFTACVPEPGRRYIANDRWNTPDGKHWHKCERLGNKYLAMRVGGCVTDSGRRMDIGAKMDDGDFVYECQRKYNGSVAMCSVGCVHEGTRYSIGDSWKDGEFVYYCKIEDGRCQKICIGCNYNNQRLRTGDRYFRDDVIYECDVTDRSKDIRIVGCLQRDSIGNRIERVVGCRWYNDDVSRRHKYEVECKVDEAEKKAFQDPLGCVYMKDGFERLFVKPNRYTIWHNGDENEAVACRQVGDKLQLSTFNPKNVGILTQGLAYDAPRGK